MSRSTPSANPGSDPAECIPPNCRLIIDVCKHSEALKVDWDKLNLTLKELAPDITVTRSICESPILLAELVKDDYSRGVVIVGCGDADHFRRYKHTGAWEIPPNYIEVADLRLLNAYGHDYDAFNFNVKLHIVRAAHASELHLQPKHKPFQFSNTVSRRQFFRAATATLEEYSDTPAYQSRLCAPYIKYCNHCISACHYGAVRKAGSYITFDDDKCNLCGACVVDCPNGALQNPNLSDVQLVNLLESAASESADYSRRGIIFTCDQGIWAILKQENASKLPKGVGVAKIPCVAAVGSLHYMAAAALNLDLLALCPNSLCKRKVALNLSRSASEIVNNIVKEAKRPSPNLRLIETEIKDDVVSLLNQDLTPKTVANKLPVLDKGSKRRLLTTALSSIASAVDCEFKGVGSPFCNISVDTDTCTLCGACSRVCPENALESIDEISSLALVFTPEKCSFCYACETACPEHSIHVERAFNPKELTEDAKVMKIKDSKATCLKCGGYLGPARKLEKVEKLLSTNGVDMHNHIYLCVYCKSQR